MALMYVCSIIFLMFYLNSKGKAYREQKRRERIAYEKYLRKLSKQKPTEKQIKELLKQKQEAAYRKELTDQGYSDDLITTILPTILDDKE